MNTSTDSNHHPDNMENIPNFSTLKRQQKTFQQDNKTQKNSYALAEQWKLRGNELFKKLKYQQAIKCYQQAIALNPTQPKYLTNLAISYSKNKQFRECVQCITKMQTFFEKTKKDYHVQLKASMIKFKAVLNWTRNVCLSNTINFQQCHQLREQLIETLKQLGQLHQMNIKKHNQSPSEHIDFLEQVQTQLQNGYKLYDYFHSHIENRQKNLALVSYLKELIRCQKVQKNFAQNQISCYFSNTDEVISQFAKIQAENKIHVQQEQQFEDFMIDPIIFESFCNPMIVPSGLTYQQAVIKEHFKKNSLFDPITRQYYEDDFRINDVIGVPNKAIQNLITFKGKKVRKGDIFYMQC